MESLYRNTYLNWLTNFIDRGNRKTRKFTSLSKSSTSGNTSSRNDFGDVRIEFDALEIYKQGAITVEYNEIFFRKHPEIFYHVMDEWDDIDEFYECVYREYYFKEEEVIIKNLKFTPNLIKKVSLLENDYRLDYRADQDTLKEFENYFEISYE